MRWSAAVLYVDTVFVLPYLKPVGTAIRTDMSTCRYRGVVTFTSNATLDLNCIEGAVQKTTTIKLHISLPEPSYNY